MTLCYSQEYESVGVDSPTFVQSPLPAVLAPRRNSSSSNHSSSSSSTTTSSEDKGPHQLNLLGPPGLFDAATEGLSSSRTMLISHSESDGSDESAEVKPFLRHRRHGGRTRHYDSDHLSDMGSISSTSFQSAMSSHEDMALVDLQVQLNKPIIDCPLLLPSYKNHMTQLRCLNWHCGLPHLPGDDRFSSTSSPPAGDVYTPTYEKLCEGFTAIRMVETTELGHGNNQDSCDVCGSPSTGGSVRTPTHPYGSLFTFTDEEEDEDIHPPVEEEGVCGMASTTRTNLIVKLHKDVNIALSPLGVESVHQIIESLTSVLQNLHPMTIINMAHKQSIGTVEAKNTLKKERYMYWSSIRDTQLGGLGGGGSGSSSPDQQPSFVTSTYRESCFQRLQGRLSIPRVSRNLFISVHILNIISYY